jgi:hypothetical protein
LYQPGFPDCLEKMRGDDSNVALTKYQCHKPKLNKVLIGTYLVPDGMTENLASMYV